MVTLEFTRFALAHVLEYCASFADEFCWRCVIKIARDFGGSALLTTQADAAGGEILQAALFSLPQRMPLVVMSV